MQPTVELTYVPATPGHWSVYRYGNACTRRPVIAWALARGEEGTCAAAIHPGVTGYADDAYAVIDPLGIVTVCETGREFGTWRLFMACMEAKCAPK